MLPCVWCCMNWRTDGSSQPNDGAVLCYLHLSGGVRGQRTAFPPHILTPLLATERRGPRAARSLSCPGPMRWAITAWAAVPRQGVYRSSGSPEPGAAADPGQHQGAEVAQHWGTPQVTGRTKKKKYFASICDKAGLHNSKI